MTVFFSPKGWELSVWGIAPGTDGDCAASFAWGVAPG